MRNGLGSFERVATVWDCVEAAKGARGSLSPAGLADELDEAAGADIDALQVAAVAVNLDEHLFVKGPDGEDGDAAIAQLFEEEACGKVRRAGGDEDAVEGSGVGPAEGAVAVAEVNMAEAKCHEAFEGFVEEGLDSLDGVDLSGEAGEDCGLIAASCADFQDAVRALDIEMLSHESDNVGLADGLAVADGGCAVGVSVGAHVGREEELAGSASDGGEDARIADAPIHELLLDHLLVRRPFVELFHVRSTNFP